MRLFPAPPGAPPPHR